MKLSMYCLSLNPDHLKKIQAIDYMPVGLGENFFNNSWISDKSGRSISSKNPYYGEYTFHYWVWKNYLKDIEKGWIGFCQYRKFWTPLEVKNQISTINDLSQSLLKNIPESYEKYDSIIGEPFYVNQFRFSKFMKRNFNIRTLISN